MTNEIEKGWRKNGVYMCRQCHSYVIDNPDTGEIKCICCKHIEKFSYPDSLVRFMPISEAGDGWFNGLDFYNRFF
jgi:hypothetical protein